MHFKEASSIVNLGTDPSECPLIIRLFGGFSVLVDGQPLPPLRSRKEKWLLALLVLRSHQPVERDWLAQMLWPFPESLESQAASNLRRSLYTLRKAMGTQADRLFSPTPHTVALNLVEAHADVLAFDAALTRGALASLEYAIGLYQGP